MDWLAIGKFILDLSGLPALFSAWQQRQAGKTQQKLDDVTALNVILKKQAEADANAPDAGGLQNILKRGDL